MGRIVPLREIPTSNIFPDDIYRLKVVEVKSAYTKVKEDDDNPRPARLIYKVSSQIVEPADFKDQFFFQDFYVGTDADPEAEELATWKQSFGARNFKSFITATGVAFGDEEDDDSLAAALKGQEYLTKIVVKTEPDKDKAGNDNPYKGNVKNETKGFWAVGEKEPGSISASLNGKSKPGAAAQARPQTRQSAAVEE